MKIRGRLLQVKQLLYSFSLTAPLLAPLAVLECCVGVLHRCGGNDHLCISPEATVQQVNE